MRPRGGYLGILCAGLLAVACGGEDGDALAGSADSGGAAGTSSASNSSGNSSGAGAGGVATCGDIVLAPIEDDPDEGYIDITEFCLSEINSYRAMEGLEPYTIRQDGICCSAQEAHQALIDDTAHNGDYCDWVAQGSAGGGRNPDGTAMASVAWVPKLFWQEKGPTYEESGGHYQAMMRPETRAVACGWYAENRDNHRVMVNYW
jgi:hypothetical protein